MLLFLFLWLVLARPIGCEKDLNAVIWLEDHLKKVFKGTLLCVSHDADFLDNICSDVIELDNQVPHIYSLLLHCCSYILVFPVF